MTSPSTRTRKRLEFMFSLFGFGAVTLASGAASQGMPNIEVPTLGGTQVWQDTYVHAGWRIQENLLTKHSRLLDPDDTRMAWGNEHDCKSEFDRLRASRKIRPVSKHLVVLVHGIARSTGTFSKMKQSLTDAGFDAVAVSYPSTRATIEEHATAMRRLLARLDGTETISFVTHSMGGIVLRYLLTNSREWRKAVSIGRVVMIAPPNQGSAVARFLKDVPFYRAMYGKSGQQLVPGITKTIPIPQNIDLLIIAGGKNDGNGFNPFLEGDDDGTVKVTETMLDDEKRPFIVQDIHGTISNHARTIEATLNFLKSGKTLIPSTLQFNQGEKDEKHFENCTGHKHIVNNDLVQPACRCQ